MTTMARSIDSLDRYLSACEVLADVQAQLDDEDLSGYVRRRDSVPNPDLDDMVAMLCRQASAATKLAAVAESLCASLVADSGPPWRLIRCDEPAE